MKGSSVSSVDIIIPVLGGFSYLKHCLECIPEAMATVSYRVIIVDNNSPNKKEADAFYREHPELFVIRNSANVGFAKACNQGVKRGESPYILLLNSDAYMTPHSLETLYLEIASDQSVGAIGPKLLFSNDTPNGPAGRIQHAGLELNLRADVKHIFIGWSADNPLANRVTETFALTGACLMTRRKLWKQVEGLFEGYISTYEDVDYCLKVRHSGYKVIYEPAAVGYHYVGASAIENRVQYPLENNRQIFLLRWKDSLPWSEYYRR